MADLKRHRARWVERKLQIPEWADHDSIFCTASGKPINPAHVRRSFDRIVARAGVPDITILGMRHCHAVWLLRATAQHVEKRCREDRSASWEAGSRPNRQE